MNKAILNNDVQQFIEEHLRDSPTNIVLRKSPFADVSSKELAEQVDSKVRTEKKLPRWFSTKGIYYPPKLAIEQASSEITAEYKSRYIKGNNLIDLTGGFGVDSYFFSKKAAVSHVELNAELSAIARYNSGILGRDNIEFINADGIGTLITTEKKYDTIYIDPSRRVENRKVFRLADCEPDIVTNLNLLLDKAFRIIVKTAPLLDIVSGLNELPMVSEVHVISIKNDCKELLWIIDKEFKGEPTITCTSFNDQEQCYKFKLSDEKQFGLSAYSAPKTYIYEPDVALLKAGCFKLITTAFNVEKLHVNTHLYTSDYFNPEFIGRKFEVINVWDYKAYQKLNTIKRANVICRNFPLSAPEVKKKNRITDGGSEYLLFTTGPDNKLIVLNCKRL